VEENTPNPKPSESVIRFNCDFCGKHIRVPSIHAGKKGKCPQCKSIVIIPSLASSSPPENTPIDSKPDLDMLLQPGLPRERTAADQPEDQQYELLREGAGLPSLQPLPPLKRNYPWLIDIFLYPANIYGLIFLAIVILIPLLIFIAGRCLGVFAVIILVPAAIINAVTGMYTYWFIAQCVRDSAAGGLRVPDTMAETPGLGELLWQVLELVACFAVYAAPAFVYWRYTNRTDSIFWWLAGCGVFIYPMSLLSAIMFDSINGLNPIVIIPSIFSSFFQYCGLVILIGTIVLLYVQTTKLLPDNFFLRIALYPLVKGVELYLAMIAAHLLGRFYFKYQQKLNWDV
jgi:hypothetical protein